MRNPATVIPFVAVMVVVVVGVDVLLFRGRSWTFERLAANVGIVLVFGALYFRLRGR